MAVQTNKVAGRRHLNFTCYQDILDDVHALASGPTRALGNWSLGKICRHLAIAMDMAIDGSDFKPNVLIRTVARLLKKRYLTRPLSPGVRLPKKAAFLIPSDADTAEGIAELERAIDRLQRIPDRKPHPFFGPLTRDEWDQITFRHSAMHLGFIVPE